MVESNSANIVDVDLREPSTKLVDILLLFLSRMQLKHTQLRWE